MFRKLLVLTALLFTGPVLAQSVQQSGTVTAKHLPYWVTSGVIADGGSATDSPISSIGVTNNGGAGLCVSSDRQAAIGRNQLCFGASTAGAATISLQNYGTAAAQSLQFVINGTATTIPSSGGNFILGQTPFIAGHVPCFVNTSGVLQDCGIAAGGGVITTGVWQGTPVSVAFGGTGATSVGGAQAALGLGTLATQNANNVAITGGSITGMSTPVSASDVAIKSYVDSTASGLTILAQSTLATAAVLPNSPTYANGSSGVGATLTAGSNTTLTVDSTAAPLNTVVLVKNQASAFQNGIYTVTTAGSGAAAWVLTRATYFDQATTEMKAGSYTFVTSGSVNINTSFTLATTIVTVGTDAVNFNLFSSVGAGVTSIDAKNGAFTTGGGVTSTSGNVIQLTNASTPVRQTILSGAVNTVGFSGFANAGSGLNVNLTATATPLTMSFANGFNSTTGSVDFVGQLSADVASYWASLPASQYSFLAVDRNVSTGALTATQTLVRPQKGPAFYAPRQALLHFENNLTDDWGNTWSSSGATFAGSPVKFGSFSLRLSGSSSFAQTAQIFNPGQGNWTIDTWVNLDSNVSANIFSVSNAFGVFVGTNASGKLQQFLSSGGATWDIANGVTGSTTVTASTFHHVEETYDGTTYRLFLDGNLETSTASTRVVWPEATAMAVGIQVGAGGASTAGNWDEFDFVPYARNVANFTPPVAAYTVSGDWFDSNAMQMKTATAAGPTWSVIQRQYVAEATTNASAVSAVYNYTATSQFRGNAFSLNTGNGYTRVGNSVYLSAASQFITNSTTIGSVVPWVISPSIVPPDALSFDIQVQVAHAALAVTTGVTNQDCAFDTRLPIGSAQNYAISANAFSNYTGMGTATQTTAFTETAGAVIRIPVINGIAAVETLITGTTCTNGGANAAVIKQAVVTGYTMP